MSERLRLDPLSVDHATEMVEVLADTSLYRFTGGEAPSLGRLQRRYAARAVGHSEDRPQGWFNWIVKPINGGVPVGFFQATLETKGHETVADIAWVLSPIHQGQGMASEATLAMVGWLRSRGVNTLVA